MNTEKKAVLEQIDELIYTMEQVQITEGSIDMGSWIECGVDGSHTINNETSSITDNKVDHFCGAVACICGYQAISNRLEAFPSAHKAAYEYHETKEQVSGVVSDSMDSEFAMLFGSKDLAKSIYITGTGDRRSEARSSGLFTETELASLDHLNKDEPSAADVIEYLKICRSKVIEHTEVSTAA